MGEAMRVMLLALALSVFLLAGPGAVPAAQPQASPYAQLEALAIERSGGDLGRLGVARTWGPDGLVERTITGHQFMAQLRDALERWPTNEPASDHVVVPDSLGFGTDNPQVTARIGWPFCDTVSIFTVSARGSVVAHAVPGLEVLPVQQPSPICGGFYGPAQAYSDVTFDLTGADVALGCIAAQVLVGDREPAVGLLGGYDCSWTVACFSGTAARTQYDFFGISQDYIMGGTGTVAAGETALDVEGCVPGILPAGG